MNPTLAPVQYECVDVSAINGTINATRAPRQRIVLLSLGITISASASAVEMLTSAVDVMCYSLMACFWAFIYAEVFYKKYRKFTVCPQPL